MLYIEMNINFINKKILYRNKINNNQKFIQNKYLEWKMEKNMKIIKIIFKIQMYKYKKIFQNSHYIKGRLLLLKEMITRTEN